MRSAFQQFILLGLVCQGLAWEGYLFVLLYATAWFASLRHRRHRVVTLKPRSEGALLAAGCAVGYFAGLLPLQTPHFFLGHGLAFLQIARLLRPLEPRERTQCVIIAFLHLGVASTVVLDYRFLLLLLGALLLIPRLLMEWEREAFPEAQTPVPLRPGFGVLGALVLVMVALFVGFPRGLIGSPIQLRRGGPEGTLADAMLDPTLGGAQQTTRVLLQVEGGGIGYLRAMAMANFDNGRWRPDPRPVGRRTVYHLGQPQPGAQPRRVRVKDARFIDKFLPTDGRVVFMRGRFFRFPFLDVHDIVRTDQMWNTGNNLYEYWIDPDPEPGPLLRSLRPLHLQHPAPSPELRAWLEARVAGLDDPLAQARALEAHLRDTFEYTIGAPQLSRVNTLDDFLFNQRTGHCERFASALALLLRMQDIPSRVMVGYVPGPPNAMTGWRNVRFRDAHAWTEAWFEDAGWVQFDATPRATITLPEPYLADLLDALDVIWYLNIVNFDAPTQGELFANAAQWVEAGGSLARRFAPWVASALAAAALLVWLRRGDWSLRRRKAAAGPLTDTQVLACRYYGELLRALARQGICRKPWQTPQELVAQVAAAGHPAGTEVALVTEFFCTHRYGGRPLAGDEERAVEAALRRLKAARGGVHEPVERAG
jgi:hypothetical protein